MSDSDIKYFHLSPDDKFLDYLVANCENAAPNENVYVVRDSKEPLKYVKYNNVKVCSSLENIKDELFKYKNIEKVFIHFLANTAIPFTVLVPAHIKVYWIFWGADGYALPGMEQFLFKEKTNKFLKEAGIEKRKPLFTLLKRRVAYILKSRYKVKLTDALKRIDVCATWIKGDFDLVENFNPRMEYLFYNNNSVEQLIGDDNELADGWNTSTLKRLKGKKYIVVGNSGDPTNNHLEAFDIIKDMSDYDIVVPLSYGNTRYINSLAEEGKRILKDRFIPLYDFMERNEYNFILRNAQFIIMNHIRQQAANNILTALWYGIPVYMDSRSTLYQTFKNWELSVGEIDSLSDNIIDSSIEKNRQLLQHNMGQKKISTVFQELLKG